MPLIVDTYNVLHVVGILPPEMAGIDARGLISLLRSSRHAREKTTLVCDGIPHEHAPRGRFGPIIVKYAGSNRLADDVITHLVNESSIPRRLTVITSDREIIRAARRRRCKSLSSEEFLHQLLHDAQRGEGAPVVDRPTGRLTDEEVSEWTEEFGLHDASELLQTPELPRHLRPPPPASPSSGDPRADPTASSTPGRGRKRDRSGSPSPGGEDRPPLVDAVPAEILAEAERLLEEEAKRRRDEWPPESA